MDSNRYVYTSGNGRLENRIRLFLGGSILALFSLVLVYAFMTVDYNKPIAQETKSDEWIIKTNPKGQKSTLMLSDGSNVVLNAESELRFKREFGQSHREIYLTGEAFFEVASDSLLPFRVHSGDLITTALGTSFNINSYKENWVQVQLATGKVRVSNISEKNQAVDLVPGEEVVIGNDSQLIKSKFDLNKAFYWKEGVLGFEKVPFEEVVQSLERWYAVDIQVKKPPSSSVKISGEFKKTPI
ncbi:FecR family protein [Cyclobacterium qasimii]|uniref:Putative anti-sigma factor n=1 Tax=Cyclobacterium qasimii M12-11B TaxID=641524 RepID=S7VJF1_9BACT|nr:FecR domain-containing protein [Cyclobacterium qasimii]EPR69622.1 putative anti-sigma factor [Cyclobacterium qasimii M12-11B]